MKFTRKNRIQTAWFKIRRFGLLFIRRFKSQDVLAVYDKDVDGLLDKLHLTEKINKGEFTCPNCRCTITRENLGVIENQNNAIIIYCLSTGCKCANSKLNP